MEGELRYEAFGLPGPLHSLEQANSTPRLYLPPTSHNTPPSPTFTSENRNLISRKAEPKGLWFGEHGHIRGQRMRCKGKKQGH